VTQPWALMLGTRSRQPLTLFPSVTQVRM
jgi:hypothetical protein